METYMCCMLFILGNPVQSRGRLLDKSLNYRRDFIASQGPGPGSQNSVTRSRNLKILNIEKILNLRKLQSFEI